MGVFEYVSVLTSIVVGLAMAHLLQGVATLIQHPGRDRADWIHLVWVAFMFFQAVFFWWWEFALVSLETWTLQVYLFVICYAVMTYLLCSILFPRDLEGYGGYEDYFTSRRSWFFGLMIAYFLVDFMDTWIKGAEYFVSLGLEYPVGQGLLMLGCAVGIATASRRYHGWFAAGAFLYQMSWMLRTYNTIG